MPLSYNYVSLIDNRFFKNVDEASFTYTINFQFNVTSVATASQVTLLARKKCKIILTCTWDKIAKQTRTPVAVTVVVGSWDSMYLYTFIQSLNSHSSRLSGLVTGCLSRCERQGPHRQTLTIPCQGCCCCGDCETWCWIASSLRRGAAWWWSNTRIMSSMRGDYQVGISWGWRRLDVEECNKEGWPTLFV